MGSDHQIFRKIWTGVRKISEVTELQNRYAVIRIAESRIDILSEIPEVEYVEKPKLAVLSGSRRKACVLYQCGTGYTPFLYGQGILVCNHRFRGIDYANIDFRNADGSTRISVSVGSVSESGRWGNSTSWIQLIGVEYTKGQIDEALKCNKLYQNREGL